MATAGPEETYEPSLHELQKLNVVTNGFNTPKWTVESNNGILYLKGERDTVYGINKFIMFCPPKSGMIVHIIFEYLTRKDTMSSRASLRARA